MASSVARRPTSDDWRDHRRLAAAVLSAAHNRTSFSPANLKTVIVCRQQPGDASTSAAAAASSSSPETLAAAKEEDGGDSPSTVRRRQKKILDRWAAREAREMVTTIKRQARKAELATLTTAPPPVSARSASLRREAAPSPFDSTVVSSLGTSNVRPSVRASSLIQMWRELEADAGLTPRNRPLSGGSTPETAAVVASFTGATSDGSDESDAFGDWNSDAVSTAASEPVTSASSSLNEAEKSRVVSIVKMLSTGHGASCSMPAMGLENEASGRVTAAADKVERLRGKGAVVLSACRLRGRGDMERFVARMEQERRRELVTLAEHHQASRFSYRGRLQSMLKLRSLQRQEAVQDRTRAPSCRLESNKKHSGSSISFIRERFDYRGRDCASSKPILAIAGNEHVQFPASTEGTDYPRIVNVEFPVNTEGEEGPNYTSSINAQFPMDAEGLGYASSPYQCTSDTIQYEEIALPGDLVCSPREPNDDLQEGNQSIDGSWDERNLWVSNLDWQRHTDSPSNGWHSEVAAEDIESSPQQNIRSWASGDDDSWRGWSIRRRSPCHDLFEFSDNVEIRDLLERRRVSTSLESEFGNKMNQLILSFIQRQAQLSFNENYEDDQVNHPYLGHSIGHRNADVGESISSSLMNLPYQTSPCPESLQHISFTRQSSQNVLDLEAIHDLRSEMSQIHEEINQLRLMVGGCIEWQAKLQQSIKQDIMDAIHQSVGMANSSQNFSAKSGRTNTCCICCEAQVDSLLYRCGHMCACYNCATQLQWSNGNCPICQSQIVDVVRSLS